jgi:hypothetical protein
MRKRMTSPRKKRKRKRRWLTHKRSSKRVSANFIESFLPSIQRRIGRRYLKRMFAMLLDREVTDRQCHLYPVDIESMERPQPNLKNRP